MITYFHALCQKMKYKSCIEHENFDFGQDLDIKKAPLGAFYYLERETELESATLTMARLCSTN